jgi:hypothetical protein
MAPKDERIQPMTANLHQSTTLAETIFTDTTFTHEEACALEALRIRYGEDHDLFSIRERAHLRFLRWGVRTGRFGGEHPFPEVLAA